MQTCQMGMYAALSSCVYAWNGGELEQKVKMRNAGNLKLTMKKVPPCR